MSIRLDDRYAQNFAQPGELAAMAAEVQAAQEAAQCYGSWKRLFGLADVANRL